MAGRYVAVIGPAHSADGPRAIAEEVGMLLAQAGAVVVSGGRDGVMEASCRGAKQAGGTTVGLLPGLRREEANPFVDIAIPTGMGEIRNLLVVRAADGIIAVGKGYGTLSEIGFALREGRPVIGIGTWTVGPDHGPGVVQAESAGDAVDILGKRLVLETGETSPDSPERADEGEQRP